MMFKVSTPVLVFNLSTGTNIRILICANACLTTFRQIETQDTVGRLLALFLRLLVYSLILNVYNPK